MINQYWDSIIKECGIDKHNFNKAPFYLKAEDIKKATIGIEKTDQREVRILCKQDYRDKRPEFFIKQGLFLLPVKNGEYAIIKGEGYTDIPSIECEPVLYKSKLTFELDTLKVGNSRTQHLDFVFATSMLKTFIGDNTLVLTIRGKRFTPVFSFSVGKHKIQVRSIQSSIDGGYEGKKQVVLVKAQNRGINNLIIRQLFYPFRQWSAHTKKKVIPVFFEKEGSEYRFWQFGFRDGSDYNSIYLVRCCKYVVDGV